MEDIIRQLLKKIGEDPTREGLKKTPERVKRSFEFLTEGYLPTALNNFLMFLGWNPGTEKEVYSMEEFIKDFSIEHIQKTDLVAFDRQKLLWINGLYIRNMPSEELWEGLQSWAKRFDVFLHGKGAGEKVVFAALDLVKDRMKLLSEYNSLVHYFFEDPEIEKEELFSFVSDEARGKEILEGFKNIFSGVSDWEVQKLDTLAHEFIAAKEYKPKEAFMTLRIALTGETATPQILDILGILGKEAVLKRLDSALKI